MAATPKLNGKPVTARSFLHRGGVIAGDLLTKWLAFHGENLSQPRVIIPNFFDLCRVRNYGGRFRPRGRARHVLHPVHGGGLGGGPLGVWKYGRSSRRLTFALGCVFRRGMGNCGTGRNFTTCATS